jgi:hypothetical protein
MEFKLIDELGNTYYHTYTVYVVPSAHLGYIDTIGNRMVMWDDGDDILDNPFILIEGFDPTNENNANLYFQKSNGLFDQVLSLGRDILVFDFANGGIDMVVNAQYITDAVNYINGVKMGSSGIILAGVSMGGVVCRYALAKEEQDGTPLNFSHFVSIDSPQQDAVIDKTLQDYMKSKGISPASLSSLAAKQLLRENVFSTGNEHQNFYNALNVLNGDGYPHLPVNIAIPFSPNVANPNSGLWLEVRNSLGIGEQTFNIITGSPIKNAILESPPYIFLEQNYPNPFNAVMEIRYHTKEPALVTLCVYDLMGRPMIVLVDEFMQAGYHRIMFDAKDLPSGIYLYRLAAGMQSQTRTLVFIK